MMHLKPLQAIKSVPYTVVLSALIGFAFAPGLIQLWSEGLRWYDANRPVVRMQAEVMERGEDSLTIRLTGTKLRDCNYLGLYAYGVDIDGALHDVHREKVDIPEDRDTRPMGRQDFGVWRVWPVRWVSVSMYSRHDCNGRVVLTKLVDVPVREVPQ